MMESAKGAGMVQVQERSRERRLRRMADRQGLTLQKSARRDPRALDFGLYRLVDVSTDEPLWGPSGYTMNIDDVENFLTGETRS